MFNPQTLLAQQPVNTTKTLEVPPVVDKMFAIFIDHRTNQILSCLGLLIVASAICIWCTHTYKTIKGEGSRPKAKEVFYMLLLTVLLFGDINDMKDSAYGNKNIANNFIAPINKIVAKNNTLSETERQMVAYHRAMKIKYQSSFW
jgi:hypothetical protein